jgi:hypothetical protein
LLHISNPSCHLQTARIYYLVKLHKYIICSCWVIQFKLINLIKIKSFKTLKLSNFEVKCGKIIIVTILRKSICVVAVYTFCMLVWLLCLPGTYLPYYFTQSSLIIVQSGWTVRGSNPGGAETFLIRPEKSVAHPASFTFGTGLFTGGVKRPGAWRLTTHLNLAQRLKKRVELHLCPSSVLLWEVTGRTALLLSFTLNNMGLKASSLNCSFIM